MIKRLLLFPTSAYLTSQWWHRLATVLFWAWGFGALIWCWNEFIYSPWASCIEFEVRTNQPSDYCGEIPSYILRQAVNSSAGEIVFTTLFISIGLYLLLSAPSLLYRVLLFIGKGSTWRDQRS